MDTRTEDSIWLVINLTVMFGRAKLLQELLRHKFGVTAVDAIQVTRGQLL